ncbi:MAG: hypothetical protein N2037_10525 [Acidimicrobiales bacterium]|nr:hypothetical protein [Acidimicrobiales bacterium]
MINTLFAEELTSPGSLVSYINGLDELQTLIEPFTPEAAAPFTGIDAATVRKLAHEFATAPSGAVYSRIGTCTVPFRTLASWAADVVNLLTGNLDRPGGAMFPLAAHAQRPQPPAPGRGSVIGRHHSRVRGYPKSAPNSRSRRWPTRS